MTIARTERLIVRRWDPARDLDDAYAFYGDPQTMRFIPCGPLNRERTAALLDRMLEREREQGFGIWAVVSSADGRVIGECGITRIPGHETDIEIAWIFDARYRGQGLATEAARAVAAYAFEQAGVRTLYALIDRENGRSIALAHRLGMRFDRIVRAYNRDLMRYRLLREGV